MSSLNETPQGIRIAIAFLGRRNAGKSSLLNALVEYDLAIVSDIAGTTTDPVKKAVEISPLGPCLVIDTAGIDDAGELGQKRMNKTRAVIEDCHIGLIVVGDGSWTSYEEDIYTLLRQHNKPVMIALNKTDSIANKRLAQQLCDQGRDYVIVSAVNSQGINELKEKIGKLEKGLKLESVSIIGDMISSGDLIVLVVPIDLSAPKGRLILPQVQIIRDILDNNASALVVKETELAVTLKKLNKSPRLIITDSQVVLKVVQDVPEDIPLTTFSTVFARFKGDLRQMVNGVRTIDKLHSGDKILIAEACTHHAMEDDIGRIKIPNWIRDYTGKDLQFDIASGPNFTSNLQDYSLIVQCGGCTITRQAYTNRLHKAAAVGVPITNYGVAISYVQGVLDKVIKPFPELRDLV